MNWNRVFILAWFDLRHALLRLKGLVFLIPFLLFWYWILKFIHEQGSELLVSKESFFLLSWLYKPAAAQILLFAHPASLSVFLIIALASAPFFSMLGSCDQLAGDAARKSLRYFLTRCTRAEIFLGRFLGSYALIAAATICVAGPALFISWQIDRHSAGVLLSYAAQVVSVTLLFLLPYVAYMAAISALMSSALSTLLMGMITYLALSLAGGYLSEQLGVKIALVPGGIKDYLLGIHPQDLVYGITALLLYTFIYAAIGWFIFQRRNI